MMISAASDVPLTKGDRPLGRGGFCVLARRWNRQDAKNARETSPGLLAGPSFVRRGADGAASTPENPIKENICYS